MDHDHRRLGRDLDLFDTDPLVGAGLPLWLPAGAAARHAVETHLWDLERRAGYQHVYSPVLGRREMYQRSGHWDNFADDMFPPMPMGTGDDALVLRPSLCPHHALIFKARQRSRRDLPLRIAELGGMYRAERSGVLGGLHRVRSIWLNDAHTFCAVDQLGTEVTAVLRLIAAAHTDLGLHASGYRLSLRGPGGKYVGPDDAWQQAESLLRAALDTAGLPYHAATGEAAFYGPKIDVQITDAAGRGATLSTIQIDFHQPARFDLGYTDTTGSRQRPVMVHRSLVGSMERLFAHLIEAHAGAFPVWYAPVQLAVLPLGSAQQAAADTLATAAMDRGLRTEVHPDGSLGARIRTATTRRVPYLGVIGPREADRDEVAVRLRDGRQLPPMPTASALALVGEVAATRAGTLLPDNA